jgi:GNAT superfamily N-acetyltransferase
MKGESLTALRIRRVYSEGVPVAAESLRRARGFPEGRGATPRWKKSFRPAVFVADDAKGRPLGFALLLHEPRIGAGFIETLQADPGPRGEAVRRALFERLRSEARALGAAGLFAEAAGSGPSGTGARGAGGLLRELERLGARPLPGLRWAAEGGAVLLFDGLGRAGAPGRPFFRRALRAILLRHPGPGPGEAEIRSVLDSLGRDPLGPADGAGGRGRPGAREVSFRREPREDDRARVREILEATGYFYPSEVDVALELLDDRIEWRDESDYRFVFAEVGGRVAGYTCYGPIDCTVSSHDLFWIAVDPAFQGGGVGRVLLLETERAIVEAGGTRVYAETSGRPLYENTRAFYERCGYFLSSTLEDFYAPGDSKDTYCKVLAREAKPAGTPGSGSGAAKPRPERCGKAAT